MMHWSAMVARGKPSRIRELVINVREFLACLKEEYLSGNGVLHCLHCHRSVGPHNPSRWTVGGIGVTGCRGCSGNVWSLNPLDLVRGIRG